MTPGRRFLPAYARELADARRRGLTLADPVVSVRLHGLQRGGIGYGVAVPDDREPGALDWGWTRGLDVLVFRRGESEQRVADALRAIKACRPRRLLVIDATDPQVARIHVVIAAPVRAT